MGKSGLDAVFVHDAGWYQSHDVELRLGSEVTAIDPATHLVTTASSTETYDKLLVATGASPRRLPMADDSGASVSYLRTIDDSNKIKAALKPGTRIVIIGAGWIGLEVASAARHAGSDVTVIESLELPLLRVLGPEVASVFASLHTSHGVDLRTASQISAITANGQESDIDLADGSHVVADLVVVGVGASPNTALAQRAGLKVDNGVVVDEHLRSSDPDVYAAGDVANAYHPRLGRYLRVEHWNNAIEQGIVAARNMIGAETTYDRLPYFYTDQYDLGMEYVGNVGPDGYEEVIIRGDTTSLIFTAYWLRDGQVLAGMHVNDWDAIDSIRSIVSSKTVDIASLRG
jgi:3-phenylpropionate/trans-cinnamate dioxygenase ferredoxin reductase component